MTPRQLHALAAAIDIADKFVRDMPQDQLLEYQVYQAKKALAFAWSEYRASRIDARERPARRALQRVAATEKGE